MSDTTLTIDGRLGEGGGQVLRSALSLSMVTGRPIHVHHIRGGRPRPGLLRQHLTALRAAATISGATVDGDALLSSEIRFAPGRIIGGDHGFAVGSAGSASLVLQTLIPALLVADAPARVHVSGGTHNQQAPPFHFLKACYLPVLQQMGAQVDLHLDAWGFHPAGGGGITALVQPSGLRPVVLRDRGALEEVRPVVALSQVRDSVGRRELRVLTRGMGLGDRDGELLTVDSRGPGNIAWLELRCEHATALFCDFGARGRRAEHVAQSVLSQARAWLAADVPVDALLADQLLLPLALAGGGSLVTTALSSHSRTSITVIERFLPVRFAQESEGERVIMSVERRPLV